jgi:YD repeat-containing protein
MLEEYTWNSANRLAKHKDEKGDFTRYTYDGDGLRNDYAIFGTPTLNRECVKNLLR